MSLESVRVANAVFLRVKLAESKTSGQRRCWHRRPPAETSDGPHATRRGDVTRPACTTARYRCPARYQRTARRVRHAAVGADPRPCSMVEVARSVASRTEQHVDRGRGADDARVRRRGAEAGIRRTPDVGRQPIRRIEGNRAIADDSGLRRWKWTLRRSDVCRCALRCGGRGFELEHARQ